MYWRLQTRYFSHLGDYTICVFDNCGSGKSTIAPGPYRISQMAKDAQLVLDHLGWKDDIHVVGVSLGGMIAQELCLLNSKCETGDRNSPPRFASVTLVDTWHSSALAVPTAKEVKFSFNGMSALGSNPKHLIDLVFSRDWINKPFRDPVKTAEQGFSGEDDDDIKLTNREVLSRLFKAIQLDLNLHRMSMNEQPHALTPSPANDTSQIDPENTPMARKASTPQPQTRPKVAPNPLKGSERQTSDLGWSSEAPHMHHSISAAAVATLQHLEQAASPEIAHALPGHSGNNSSESLAGTPPTPSRENSYSTRSDYSIPSMTVGTKREVSGDLHQFMACLGHRLTSQRVRAIRKLNPRTRFLVIHGEKDRVIRPICGRTLAKLLGCPIVWIEGAGHMPLIDAHCTFNLIVRAFTREEKWIEELPDRTCITPASWEEQVRVRRWIMNPTRSASGDSGKEISLNVQDSNNSGPEHIRLACASSPPQPEETPTFEQATAQERQDRRTSRISYIKPVGPLAHELFFVDENDASLGGKFIPANSEDHQKQATAQQAEADAHRLRELIICGSLLDAPLRLRRYSLKTDRTVI
ncbi:alpha/beta-hydrolase [Martensiomyces pterosporus]|nr:alpha/beta-hydrolase [Martensiomyces pterosporus]